MITTGYNDLNGKEILLGDKVKIIANPHFGEYEVKFGEYRLEPFKKHQIEVPHLGFYLTNGETIVSFMYVIKQPTGYASGIHTIEVIGSSIVKKSVIEDAISKITTELKNDKGYRESWKANIAMSYKDCENWYKRKTGKKQLNNDDKHIIANESAERFLKLLCD